MDIGDEAVAAIMQSLKQQAGHMQTDVVQHPDLAEAMLQSVEFEYVDGMEWGFHCAEERKDIAYSVSQTHCVTVQSSADMCM